jgi:hypothetical protein
MPETNQDRPKRRKATVALPTPNPNLVVLKMGDQPGQLPQPKVARSRSTAVFKPGIDRRSVFYSSLGLPVFIYYVDAEDTSKIVREDEQGRRVVGRLVNGHFRAFPTSKAR